MGNTKARTYHNVTSLSFRKTDIDRNGNEIPGTVKEAVILYNEGKFSFENIKHMLADKSYLTSNEILVIDKELADNLADL